MSQVTSAEVPSGSGLSVRSGINAVLSALISNNSGSSPPPNPVPGQLWFDTNLNDFRIRNSANSEWQLISDMIGAVEYDRGQSLNATQQAQARANIGLEVFNKFPGGSRMQAPGGVEDIRIYENGDWGAFSDAAGSWRPLAVNRGGTGALDPANARTNLGAAAKLPAPGAIESMVWAVHLSSDVVYGGSYPGSSLRPTGAASSIYVIGTGFTASAGLGGGLPGTWVCLGQGIRNSTTPGISAVDFAYLFQRIA